MYFFYGGTQLLLISLTYFDVECISDSKPKLCSGIGASNKLLPLIRWAGQVELNPLPESTPYSPSGRRTRSLGGHQLGRVGGAHVSRKGCMKITINIRFFLTEELQNRFYKSLLLLQKVSTHARYCALVETGQMLCSKMLKGLILSLLEH